MWIDHNLIPSDPIKKIVIIINKLQIARNNNFTGSTNAASPASTRTPVSCRTLHCQVAGAANCQAAGAAHYQVAGVAHREAWELEDSTTGCIARN
jgi:hypothetical protein